MSTGQPDISQIPPSEIEKQIADVIGQLKRLSRDLRENSHDEGHEAIRHACAKMGKLHQSLSRLKGANLTGNDL